MTPTSKVQTLLGVVLLLGCGGPEAEPSLGDELHAEVESFLEDYMAAVGAGDTAQIRRAIDDRGRFVWIEDGAVRYRSGSEVIAGLAQLPPGSMIRTELTDLFVVPVGQTGAHAWADFETVVGEGVSALSFGGAISFVLERSGDSWALVGGHTSAPRQRGGQESSRTEERPHP